MSSRIRALAVFVVIVCAAPMLAGQQIPRPPTDVRIVGIEPVIWGVTASSVTASQATISWTTDLPSDSQVQYGPTTSYGSLSLLDPTPVTAHSVTLTGLASARVYHFAVRSRDVAGTLRVSADYTVTTAAAPDTTGPVVSISAPATGATVSGSVTVSAAASDNVGVAGVQFRIDGANLGAEDTTAPYAVSWNTAAAVNGPHTITAVARDAAGNATISPGIAITVSNDSTAPVISVVLAGSLTSSQATITWTTNEASDSQVEYGPTTSYGSATTVNVSLVTAHAAVISGLTPATLYHFRVRSRDAAGNVATSGDFTFTTAAAPDTTKPAVSVTAPAVGAVVSGTVTVTAAASDNVGVAGVQFKLDGVNLSAEDTSAPYSVAWNSTSATNGAHTLTAVARDAAGNTTTSAPVTVSVVNDGTAPAISAVNAGSITSSQATITWTTNEASDSQVEYGTTTAYGSTTPLNGSMVTSHTVALSGLSANTLYHYRVRSRDAAGNLVTSGDFTFTTSAPPDTTKPVVSLTAPAGGTTVSGSITVTASATDNVAVTGVQFKLDGVSLGAEDASAPYSVSWDTATVTNGPHSLTAVGRDAAGNTTTSAAVTVTVSNAVTTILTLSPQDTSLTLDATNRSTEATLTTYTWPSQRVANAILMKFDLTALPAGAVVQDASLRLALVESDASTDPTYSVPVHKLVGKNPVITAATGYTFDGVNGWTANACCNNNVPMAQGDISAAYDTQAVDKTLGFKSWDVTALVDEWAADPSANFGLLLNSDAARVADRYRYFASMEHADPALRPHLRITYSMPAPDPTPPTVSMTAPAAGATVSGTVTVSATASDNVGVASVQFQLDGANLGAKDTSAPYSISWNTTTATAGTHTLRAVARDAAGNATTSAGVTVTVTDNTAPVISAVVASGITAVGAAIAWTTNEASDSQVEYGSTTAYGSTTTLNVSLVTTHAAVLSGLSANTLYHYRVRSRDAAGNLATSPDFSFTTTAAGGGGVIFESNWPATGTSTAAITDGGRWPNYWEFNNGSGAQLMSVVTGGPNGHNALRVQQRGSSLAADVQLDNFLPQSTDFYVRFYMRNDDTSSAGDHIVTADTYNYANLTYIRKNGGASGWRFVMSMYGCGGVYPIVHWGPAQALTNGQWYRFEYHVDFVNGNHIQVHPRVYDAAGTLILSDAGFRQEDYGSATWNGRSDWTLASYYAAGHSFCVNPTWVNDFAMGNNGQAGAVDTGLYWYYAGVQIRTDTWPGPLAGGGGDTTPPTVSLTSPAAGATVSGTATTVSATASDSGGVAGVQFKLDGANLGAEDTTAPYSISWNTTGATNGSHSLTAVARDAAGNTRTSAAVTVTVSNGSGGSAGIAARYPGDVGIESDPEVVFVEKFEQANTSDLFARWTDIGMPNLMSLSTDVPAGSPGNRSLNAAWQGGTQNTTGLFKQLPGVSDTLHVRYYIKYPTTGLYRHDGIWMGGYNPPLTYPNPRAGVKPVGNDRFSASAEQSDNHSQFDTYSYWMNMRAGGDGMYWGNNLLNDPDTTVPEGQWVCVEQMIKLNNPVSSFNGEHAIWVNGVKISHLGQGFPNGRWSGGTFTQDPTGSPFEGFRWRSDTNLNLNWIWLLVYSPDDPSGFTGNMKYDHVVVAKSYIGCLAQ